MAKYNADQLKAMAKSGAAMPDGSYPIGDKQDLQNAIRAVGRGGGSHDAIRRHIMKRAQALGAMDMIPENWMADGSMRDQEPDTIERTLEVPFMLERDDTQDSDGLTLEGYAAVFNRTERIEDHQGIYDEVIAPGAFQKSISERMPVLMFNHGKSPLWHNMPIGKITELREDPRGLFVRARLSDNWLMHPIRDAIADGAIPGMSIRAEVVREDKSGVGRKMLRTIREAKLYELSPVTFPAYTDTTVAIRALEREVPDVTVIVRTEHTSGTSEDAAPAGTSDDAADAGEQETPRSPSTLAERQQLARQIVASHRGVGKRN